MNFKNIFNNKSMKKQELRKSILKKLRQQKKDIQDNIDYLIDSCKHEDLEIRESGSAKCNICDQSFKWYCPTSPTLKCNYDFINEDGEEDYNEDDCIYCHQPEERK